MISFIRPAPADMIESLVLSMNRTDQTELSLLSGNKPIEALQSAVNKAAYSFCAMLDNQPVAIGGIIGDKSTPALIWMVAATEPLSHHRKSFLQASQAETKRMSSEWPCLRAYVDRRWRKSLKWLDWLGFEEAGEFELLGRYGKVLELRRCQN